MSVGSTSDASVTIALMAYLGPVPGEDSSGEKHRRGRITRTGNALVRPMLVEVAWHYQHRPSIGVALARRRKGHQAASKR
jgi:transposase